MTIQEFLNLLEPEQAIEAAKCFTEKPWPHRTGHYGEWLCVKCRKTFHRESDCTMSFCPIPDPITIDWNTAKRLQGECLLRIFWESLRKVYDVAQKFNTGVSQWAVVYAKPIHYIAACMAAKGYFK